MDKLAALVVRLSQIRVEFGDEVAARAVYAASVAAAQIVLQEAEAEALNERPAPSALVIAFPLLERTAQRGQETEPST